MNLTDLQTSRIVDHGASVEAERSDDFNLLLDFYSCDNIRGASAAYLSACPVALPQPANGACFSCPQWTPKQATT